MTQPSQAPPTPQTAPADTSESDEIIARPGLERRLRVGGVALLLFGCAGWFAYDGYIKYPRENEIAVSQRQHPPHNDQSLAFQRGVACVLPMVALALLGWMFYASRGQYRLAGNILHIPGTPPIDLTQIVSLQIDKRKWLKKGIAYIDYELADGTKGEFMLDDMYYQRKPTDEIFDRLESLQSDEEPVA